MKQKIFILFMSLGFIPLFSWGEDYENTLKYIEQNNLALRYYKPDLNRENVRIFWKDETDEPYITLANLMEAQKQKGHMLLFAMNGGIYSSDGRPGGLYIENYKPIKDINLNKGSDNFHAQPNGVFYMKDNKPYLVISQNFTHDEDISMAVQSGPMLIYKGKINDKYTAASASLNIRNGVCINKKQELFFIQSLAASNMYNFGKAVKDYFDCENFLYLDGFLSHMQAAYGKNEGEQIRPFVSIIATEEKRE